MRLILLALAVDAACARPPATANAPRPSTVHVRFGLELPELGMFPSDAFTVPDAAQRTGLRVRLPRPDCGARPSECRDLALTDALDGFNLQPRVTVPFDVDIDPASVASASLFFVELDDPASIRCACARRRAGRWARRSRGACRRS